MFPNPFASNIMFEDNSVEIHPKGPGKEWPGQDIDREAAAGVPVPVPVLVPVPGNTRGRLPRRKEEGRREQV